MLNFVDNFLNKITMYRLVLCVLIFYSCGAVLLSIFKLLPYTPIDLLASVAIILVASLIFNWIFERVYKAPTNFESVYITALILFLIVSPAQGGVYSQFLPLAIWASIWAVATKYILAIGKKHIFNPAAVAVVITAFALNLSASWWVGTVNMLPFVAVGGVLVIRKIRRADLMWSFIITSLATISIIAFLKGSDIATIATTTVKDSAFFFFAFIMLTEPQTTPPTRWLRILYGALVGFLFAPALHIGSVYSTPELALIIGNVFSYLVSPKEKLILRLRNRIKIAADTFDFVFTPDKKFVFKPGQYMEWTMKHRSPDNRGNRRYFTIASSPTERDVHMGVKFYPEPSSYKNHLLALSPGGELVVSGRAGDFVMPKDSSKGLVFIAGGIGITPYRSMIKYLLDNKEKRPITIFYSNKTVSDIAYKDILDLAQRDLGIRTVYNITGPGETAPGGFMKIGQLTEEEIKKEVPDFTDKIFYISGPHAMVNAFKKTLKSMGVRRRNIKIDFFPGFA